MDRLIQTLDNIRSETLTAWVGGIAAAVLGQSGAKNFKDNLCLTGIEYGHPRDLE